MEAAQFGDELLGNAVGEEILFGVAAQVVKGRTAMAGPVGIASAGSRIEQLVPSELLPSNGTDRHYHRYDHGRTECERGAYSARVGLHEGASISTDSPHRLGDVLDLLLADELELQG